MFPAESQCSNFYTLEVLFLKVVEWYLRIRTGIMESVIDVEEAPHKPVSPTISHGTVPEQIDAKSIHAEKIDSWRDFTEKTTFHGIRYMFEKRGLKFRR